jgi:hypothetical protein
MQAQYSTIDRLHLLESLYRQGYQSDVIDQSIDKLLMLERAAAQRDLENLEQRLRAYEEQYHMASADFHQRFCAGQTSRVAGVERVLRDAPRSAGAPQHPYG